jgi:transcriptional regulator with XRE-family HTH domain
VNKSTAIGMQLRAARKVRGLTLRDVAARSRGTLSPAGLSLVEQGKRHPTLRTLLALVRVLGLEVTVNRKGVTVRREEQ